MASAETIAAIATAAGRAGIGVVRVSGERLEPLVQALLGDVPAPRTAVLRRFRDAAGETIDQGIALYFAAPHSYTGENVLELHGHGGNAVLQMLLRRCLELGARLATPGEFTQRAFANDKLDLAQAEAVAELIDASSARAARCALRTLTGEFSRAVDKLMKGIVELRAQAEATLDFPDEEIDLLSAANARAGAEELVSRLDEVLAASRRGSLLREGIHVVLAGRPNVGKSSLLNRLAGEDLAIVTEQPGTTRDPVRQAIDIHGISVQFTDTAGLREPADQVEKLGIDKALDAISRADVVLLVEDAAATVTEHPVLSGLPADGAKLTVRNKIDLTCHPPGLQENGKSAEVNVSAFSGAGIDVLREQILRLAGWQTNEEGAFMARERHLRALEQARAHLLRAQTQAERFELFAEELRLAHGRLMEISGQFTSEDVLGEIFSRFCIGK
jgi:tRNA modification GTPase